MNPLRCRDGHAVEPLPAALEEPPYAAPVLEPMEVPFPEMAVGCAEECVDCGPICAQPSYWYGGVDLLVTRFNYHTNSIAIYNSRYTSDEDATLAVRPYLGWESSTGTGIRTRLWFFEGQVQNVVSPSYFNYYALFDDYVYLTDIESNYTVSASYFDIDFYRRLYYDRTSLLFGVGTKAASVSTEHTGFFGGQTFEEEYRAGGVSVFAEGNHPLYLGPKYECGFIGYGRISLLTGEVESGNRLIHHEDYDLDMSIVEIGLGLELKRKFRRGDLLFQVVSEIQRWEMQGETASDMSFDALGLRLGGQW